MVYRFDFTVGSVEADVIGRATGVDIRRFPLRISNTTVFPERYAQLARMVHDDLVERKLSTAGELHRGVRLAFELLGTGRVSVAITGTDVEFGELAVLSATDGAQAVFISQPGGSDDLHFSLFEDEELVRRLAAALPTTPAAPGSPLVIRHREDRPKSAMAALRQAEAEFEEEETEAFGNVEVRQVVRPGRGPVPEPDPDYEQLEEIFARPRIGGGYIVVTGVGRHGEQRGTSPTSWLDTEDGRYLVQTTTGTDGTLTARYVPAGGRDVARAIQDMISAVY
ncbi:ESX secretion-associated protein EspG [Amycolatopsis acidicola]|uniref:ESX secretion-associated protein EspG n=1 Tax=Amycolatopsis acidicola TaxID=2596893 RepID=A0A5N0VJU1_9PSEU|nr:ESX secretion-associated protein EspG [Amycolatopsis acidicola]KAA9165624.1 ESX secretion-associated protein EspG [Amycolatopsis acidicola]